MTRKKAFGMTEKAHGMFCAVMLNEVKHPHRTGFLTGVRDDKKGAQNICVLQSLTKDKCRTVQQHLRIHFSTCPRHFAPLLLAFAFVALAHHAA